MKAAGMLGDALNEPGVVPPRVLKETLDGGYFCEDEITAHYFGGVLASSRSRVVRDDRGATYAALISRLSAYQIRSHHVLYATAKRVHGGKVVNVLDQRERNEHLKTFIALEEMCGALELGDDEDANVLLPHVFHGLAREGLIDDRVSWGSGAYLQKQYGMVLAHPGLVFVPSPLGIELHLWAFGLGRLPHRDFLALSRVLDDLPGIRYPQGLIRIKDEQSQLAPGG
jgi:hypothetical protein